MESSAATMAMSFSSSSFFSLSRISNPNLIFKPTLFLKPKTNDEKRPFLKPFRCIQSPSPDSTQPGSRKSLSCSAVTFSPSQTAETVPCRLARLIAEFHSLPEPVDRVKRLLHYATQLRKLDDSARVDFNRVMGCTARVWLQVEMDQFGKMRFFADSDSEITRGLCACLISVLDETAPDEVLAVKTDDLAAFNVGLSVGERSRVNTWHNVLVSMQKRTRVLLAQKDGTPPFEPFPSLVVTKDGIEAKGSYAQAQVRYLFPDQQKVKELVSVLKEKKIGVVAHFYMDPEVQGILTAAQNEWPHIYISDSLVMADTAVKMAKAGCEYITVLGVDFMSENVRAILDQAGFGQVCVYRMSNERIGCSLADAAETPIYMNYLETASASPPSLHVIYINTSLETKAFAHELVPTITCTSSNVVQTVLQAFAQVPDLNLWYGPDSYMGANIKELFQQMTMMSDEEIADIHPEHNRNSIRSLLPRLHYFEDGKCIVHHLFGREVVQRINEMYCDAFLTAHFEVPGEMFSLAMEAKRRGMGVVGSTKNILDFIKQRVIEALDRNVDDHLQFVLGTESGMVTSIVAAVRNLLGSTNSSAGCGKVSVEIVFPVSSESVTQNSTKSSSGLQPEKMGDFTLPVIPGVASGEGCSIHGGCASCPYMKMNSLTSLLKICHEIPDGNKTLSGYEAERFKLHTPMGKSIADVGCEPILHMRHFQATKKLSEKLVNEILHR